MLSWLKKWLLGRDDNPLAKIPPGKTVVMTFGPDDGKIELVDSKSLMPDLPEVGTPEFDELVEHMGAEIRKEIDRGAELIDRWVLPRSTTLRNWVMDSKITIYDVRGLGSYQAR